MLRRLIPVLLVAIAVPALADEAPKGELTKHTFSESRIFPGTVRDFWVYVPRQYDPAKPACVYVNQDGVQFNAPAVFDRLIATKEMPVTIGVFVTPGRVKAASAGALDRFNRSFEYDGLGDAYARFLLDELLPYVARQQKLNLSHDGNDRGIGGSSSGAVCAFTAAWERPDAFRRVFSAIGTYVGLRGANCYPTLIRKTEPKPLRVFLQDGSADLNIYGGDWWMVNQEMERALVFAGYEVNHVWGDGGHNGKHATEIFADAMRWLWKDWPAPIKTGAGSPQLQEILLPGEGWQTAATGPRRTDGAIHSLGGRYRVEPNEPAPGRVWFVMGDAKKLVDEGLVRATGWTLSPDQSLLYVADGGSHWVYSYQVQPDGTLRHKQRYYHLHVPDTADDSGAAGMCVDRQGRLYVATRLGIQICDQAGRVNCVLPTPGPATDVYFAGEKLATLTAVCGKQILQRRAKPQGVAPSQPPLKPAPPKL